ncbi:MAG: tRNA-dihydrouridine synthase [Candidatus Doudnabacteria bacterium]|nr:tRNA-dihydrouridine synthase [Candidatus Doudnabacteria bacterium]
MDFTVELAGQRLTMPIMNGAGSCKIIADVNALARTPAGAIVVGSGTVKGGMGNANNTFDWNEYRSLNSLGLPNPGEEGYQRDLPEMVNIAHEAGKLLYFSIAGNTQDEYAEMALTAADAKVDLIEINLGCPNKFDGDKRQMRIIANLPDLSHEILYTIRRAIGLRLPISVKVTYYTTGAYSKKWRPSSIRAISWLALLSPPIRSRIAWPSPSMANICLCRSIRATPAEQVV